MTATLLVASLPRWAPRDTAGGEHGTLEFSFCVCILITPWVVLPAWMLHTLPGNLLRPHMFGCHLDVLELWSRHVQSRGMPQVTLAGVSDRDKGGNFHSKMDSLMFNNDLSSFP